jgi:hypothetical protein
MGTDAQSCTSEDTMAPVLTSPMVPLHVHEQVEAPGSYSNVSIVPLPPPSPPLRSTSCPHVVNIGN